MADVVWRPEFVYSMAEVVTGRTGFEALRQFSKQLVLGASREAGDEDMTEVFANELVEVCHVRVLTRMSFANDAARYRWVFDELWVQDPVAWAERGCVGLALVGMDDDADLFFVAAEEAAGLLRSLGGILVMPMDHPDLNRWRRQWQVLCSGEAHDTERGEDAVDATGGQRDQ